MAKIITSKSIDKFNWVRSIYREQDHGNPRHKNMTFVETQSQVIPNYLSGPRAGCLLKSSEFICILDYLAIKHR